MSQEYSSASETVRRALRVLRDEGLVATQATRGTFVLRPPAEAEPSPEFARLEAELREAEDRLTRHINGQGEEIAKLREELEYTQAEVMALKEEEQEGAARDEDVG
jgi:DNA-binding GntR family transcriptional regulator